VGTRINMFVHSYNTKLVSKDELPKTYADLANPRWKGRLGIEAAEGQSEPEDHVAILCEVMAGLASGQFAAEPGAERRFFERHLKPWAPRFFADLETAKLGRFYRAVGGVGRVFLAVEAEAFAMDERPAA